VVQALTLMNMGGRGAVVEATAAKKSRDQTGVAQNKDFD